MTPDTKTCPGCGAEAKGNFCASCGAALTRAPCPECGKTPAPGARFCNHCGAPLHAGAPAGASRDGPSSSGGGGDGGGNVAWWVAGALLVALILVAAYPIYGPDRSEPSPAGAGSAGGMAGGSAGPLNMSMDEAAYRLFVRVMAAADTADTATVQQFLPMAISAYEQTAPLSADDRYHVALMHQAAGDHETALDAAEEGLEESPDHLLLLSVAGESALALGEGDRAVERFEHLLEVWDDEMASGREEYADHGGQMDGIRQRARGAVEGGS